MYDSDSIEKKWEKVWEENKSYKTDVRDFQSLKCMYWICFLILQDKDFMSVM